MPNWCNNTLQISCSLEHKADLQKFKEQVAYVGEIIIPKEQVETKYQEDMDNIEMWRNRLEDWLKYKKGTPKEYFIKEKGKPFDEYGNVVESVSEFSFIGILPKPKTETENWYDWNINNWGTKWDACSVNMYNEGETELCYSFDTAWSPPLPVIRKVAELFPNLYFDFSYGECGNDFAGEMEFENGECVREESGTYIEYEGYCTICDTKLEKNADGDWTCPCCEKKICTCCYTPYEEGETECEECGNELNL